MGGLVAGPSVDFRGLKPPNFFFTVPDATVPNVTTHVSMTSIQTRSMLAPELPLPCVGLILSVEHTCSTVWVGHNFCVRLSYHRQKRFCLYFNVNFH